MVRNMSTGVTYPGVNEAITVFGGALSDNVNLQVEADFAQTVTLSGLNTNGYTLKIFGAEGIKPTIDGQKLTPSVLITSGTRNVEIDNLKIINADIYSEQGTIIRCNEIRNHKYTNLELDFGFSGFRGTDDLRDCIFKDVFMKNIRAGAFRLGNGDNPFPDIQNIAIENISFDHSDESLIIGNTPYSFGPGLVLKHARGLTVKNVYSTRGVAYGMGDVESSEGAVIERMRCSRFSVFGGEGAILKNIHITEELYLEKVDFLNLLQCYIANLNGVSVSSLGRIEGCILPRGIGLVLQSDNSDFIEKNNVIGVNDNNFHIALYFADNSTPRLYSQSNIDAWKALEHGQNTVYTTTPLTSIKLDSAGKYLMRNSLGHKIIPYAISGIITDLMGDLRDFPTDAGAYHLAGNDPEPELPTVPQELFVTHGNFIV